MPAPELQRRGATEPDSSSIERVARAAGVSDIAAGVLVGRGVDSLSAAAFCAPRLKNLRPPSAMAGFEAALELLNDARTRGLRVGIFGDYDVDGVTTTAILAGFLERLGVSVVTRVARRGSGYGFTIADANALVESGAQVILTGDCGTSDVQALSHLRDQGVPCVVIDHHQVPKEMPPAHALINPHQADCRFPFKGLCSAGVAFYLCAALRTKVVRAGATAPDPRGLLDLVALATICDMVVLREENRILTRHGLDALSQRRRPGIRALLALAGVDPAASIDEEVVSFRIGPRLNAPGRLGPAEPALRLLRANTDTQAHAVAAQVEALNARRRDHTRVVEQQALALCLKDEKLATRAALTLASTEWMPGVVGIAANAVVDVHRRPVMVLSLDEAAGVARGSVRSYGGVDVRSALERCAELLQRFGGHPQAAGVTLAISNVDAFREAFDAAVGEQAAQELPAGLVHDGVLGLHLIDDALVEELAALGPYGVGFERPAFVVEDADVISVRVLKDKHLRLVLAHGDHRQDAIAFGQAASEIQRGDRVGLVMTPGFNYFRGERRRQLEVAAIWKS